MRVEKKRLQVNFDLWARITIDNSTDIMAAINGGN